MATTEMYYGQYSFVPVPIITNWGTEILYDGKLDQAFLRHNIELAGYLLAEE